MADVFRPQGAFGLHAEITLPAANEYTLAPHRCEIRTQQEMHLLSGSGKFGSVEAADGAAADNADLHICKEKGTLTSQSAFAENCVLFGAQDGVFCRFGDPELYDSFGRNLDSLALIGTE